MISQPSNLIYLIDIPEPIDFKAEFTYNFFVADETINENSELPKILTQRTKKFCLPGLRRTQ